MLRLVSLRVLGFRGIGRIDLSSFAPSLSAAAAAAAVSDDRGRLASSIGTYRGRGAYGQFHGNGSTSCITCVRWFSGIRNMSRERSTTYTGLLKKARSGREVKNILKTIERDGFIPNVYHYSAAISTCAKKRKLDEAKNVYRHMQHNKVSPSEVTFNSLIDACAKAGEDGEALQFLRDMEESHGLWPNVWSYSSAISACVQAGSWKKAIELLREMQNRGIVTDVISYNATISACEKGGQTDEALRLLVEMEAKGIEPDVITFAAAISACEKGGAEYTDTALSLFEEMCNREIWPDVITYSATISACEKGGADYTDTALRLFGEMKEFGIDANEITYTAITKSCFDNERYPEAVEKAKEAVSGGFFVPLDASAKEWDLHEMIEAQACMLLADALITLVESASFREILIITGRGKQSKSLRNADAVLQVKVPAFLKDLAGLELAEHIKNGKLNKGAFVIAKKDLQKWAKSDDFANFQAFMTDNG